MSINQIQFQIGLSLVEFIKLFKTEKSCRNYLRHQKWPEGFCCRRCSYKRSSIQIKGIRETHECLNCFYKESLLAHTLFEHSRLPLRTWFLAIQLLTQAKTCMSAMELHRQLQVNIKTAQLIKHKLMQTLTEAEEKRILHGRIECDDAYLGGIFQEGKRGPNSDKKFPFLTAVQTDKAHHPQLVVLSPVNSLSRDEVTDWAKTHIKPRAVIFSNELDCFKALAVNYHHRPYSKNIHGKPLADSEFKWVNTILTNIKTAFSGALHAFNFRKYSARYLGHMQFRFNHRFDLKECFYEVLKQVVLTKPKPAKALYSRGYG
ncbi:MAG: IS1595 family transposase [Lentisphaeraceae bacterium]|nr:IS1595 family transposase [Lentisphaeraceae bacterium]